MQVGQAGRGALSTGHGSPLLLCPWGRAKTLQVTGTSYHFTDPLRPVTGIPPPDPGEARSSLTMHTAPDASENLASPRVESLVGPVLTKADEKLQSAANNGPREELKGPWRRQMPRALLWLDNSVPAGRAAACGDAGNSPWGDWVALAASNHGCCLCCCDRLRGGSCSQGFYRIHKCQAWWLLLHWAPRLP